MDAHDRRFRVRLLITLLILTPIGFYTKLYNGPLHLWVNNHFGGLLYEIFWILYILLVWPQKSSLGIAMGVLAATCILEIAQLWHPPFLKTIRSTFIGRIIIGTSFTWNDFPYYFLGSIAGWRLAEVLRRGRNKRQFSCDDRERAAHDVRKTNEQPLTD